MQKPNDGLPTGLTGPAEHPDRASIYDELHARATEPIETQVRIRRATYLSGPDAEVFNRAVSSFLAWAGMADRPDLRLYSFIRQGRRITLERHNEFLTLTWESSLDDWTAWPTDIGLEHLAGLLLVSATRLDVTDTITISEGARSGFNAKSLSYSGVYDGQAEIATDFIRDDDGFTRFELATGQCGALRRGVIVRRVLEIETYSSLVLLGLPMARSVSLHVRAEETELASIMAFPHQSSPIQDNRETLGRLHALANEVNNQIGQTEFRFAASQAYGDVLKTRLVRLQEKAIGEFTTIDRYLSNRIEPAIATCRATEKRLATLAIKIQRATELLNAHISLDLQTQNQAILDTISHTSNRQYRLQETVEGLSIVAISYYALAILGYVLDGLSHIVHIDKGIGLLIAAPIIIFFVWLGMWRLKRKHKLSAH